jgi:hypothetical protein
MSVVDSGRENIFDCQDRDLMSTIIHGLDY